MSDVIDLEATARRFGAFRRPRRLRTAADQFRLARLYGPAALSLRGTATAADDARIAAPEVARTWLLAHLIAAALTDDLASNPVAVANWSTTFKTKWRQPDGGGSIPP